MRKVTTFSQFLNEDPLDDLRLELALRQEFGFDKEQSKEAGAWFQGKLNTKHFQDRDVWDALVDTCISQEEFGMWPSWRIEEKVAERLQKMLRQKYKVFV